MIKISFMIRTMTTLEFNHHKDLEIEIKEKILSAAIEQKEAENGIQNVSITIPENVEKRENIRHGYSDVASIKGYKYEREEVYSIPVGIDIPVAIEIDEDGVKEAAVCLNEFTKAVNEGRIRIGKNTTFGRGRFVCSGAEIQSELTGEALGLSLLTGSFLTPELPALQDIEKFVVNNACDWIVAEASVEEGILIRNALKKHKTTNNDKKYEPNMPFIVDEMKRPIIPASTWKGIFRNTVSEWVKHDSEDSSLIDRMFGNREKGIKGNLIFYDSVIQDPVIKKSNRVHINKFSAALIEKEVRENLYVTGNFTIRIECLEDMKLYINFLYAALRDLHYGRVNVGADKGIGKGFIKITNIRQKISGDIKTIL